MGRYSYGDDGDLYPDGVSKTYEDYASSPLNVKPVSVLQGDQFLHTSTAQLNVGDKVKPGNEVSRKNYSYEGLGHDRPNWVFLTKSDPEAPKKIYPADGVRTLEVINHREPPGRGLLSFSGVA